MSDRTKDYNNYDHLAVSVKSDQLNRILQCYRALGWTEVETADDRDYYNMKYVRLVRPHKIANKDRLQYLQVRMETAINSLVEINNRAHIKSTAAAVAFSLAALAFAALAVWLIVAFAGAPRVCGYVFLGLAVAAVAMAAVICRRMRSRERAEATEMIIEKLRLTQSLIDEAVTLVPADVREGDDRQAEGGGQ